MICYNRSSNRMSPTLTTFITELVSPNLQWYYMSTEKRTGKLLFPKVPYCRCIAEGHSVFPDILFSKSDFWSLFQDPSYPSRFRMYAFQTEVQFPLLELSTRLWHRHPADIFASLAAKVLLMNWEVRLQRLIGLMYMSKTQRARGGKEKAYLSVSDEIITI